MNGRLLAIAGGSQFTLRAHLLAYGLCVAVPVLVVLGVLLMRAQALERTQLESRMLQVVSSLADDVDREIDRRMVVLQTLASSPLFAAEDWPAFYTQAKATLQGRAYIILIEPGGRQVLNTYVPYGREPATTGDPETLRALQETKRPVVSNLFTSLVVKEPVFNITIPIVRDGSVRYALSLGLLPTDLLQILQSQKLAPGWTTNIWDRNDVVLARSVGHLTYVGKPVPAALGRDRLAFDRVVDADDLDGKDVLVASTSSKLSGWRVAVHVPVATVEAPLRASLWLWGGVTFGALLLAVVAGLLVAGSMAGSIASISSAAVALGHGERIAPTSSLLKEANDLFKSLFNAQSELDGRAAALLENEAMLRALLEVNSVHARDGDLPRALGQIVDAAIAIAHADMGNIQLYDPVQRHLKIVAHRGFAPAFLTFWNTVSANEGTCGTSLARGERVIVEDITISNIFADTPGLAVQLDAHVHAMISTPIVSRSGQPLGVVSTHYKAPHRPEARILPFLDLLARQAADIIERQHAEQQQTLLTNELNHRVKNTLAIIQAIARQTLRSSPEPREFTERFSARLAALATAHNLTIQRGGQHASLEDVVRATLAPFSARSDRIVVAAGGDVLLPANLAVSFSLMLHELATNAAKYGALSAADGRVKVAWRSDRGRVSFTWREEDGPPIPAPPSREGFGSQLIAFSVAQLQGTLTTDYLPTGLCVRIFFPLPDAAGRLEAEAGKISA